MVAFSPIIVIRQILDAFYPPRCLCCGTLTGDTPLCDNCRAIWQTERDKAVFKRPDGVEYLAVYTKNRSVARTLVLTAKRSNERRLYDFLALELADKLADSLNTADFITFVPRSSDSVRKSGVDQALLLAKALSAACGVPYLAALRHKRHTAAQKTLNAANRAVNAATAYDIDHKNKVKLTGKIAVLVDDVATTGSTLTACEALLRASGAIRVIKATIASAE